MVELLLIASTKIACSIFAKLSFIGLEINAFEHIL